MEKYVALIGFMDRVLGLYVEAKSPYPPNGRIVPEQWIECLATNNNATGKPVIQKVGAKPEKKPEPKKKAPKPAKKPEPVVEDMLPLIEETPVPAKKEKAEKPNPFKQPIVKPKADPFEGLTEQGIFDIFRILNSEVVGSEVPETKEDYLNYLETSKWKKKNMAYKRELLTIFGVVGASKFEDFAVDKALKDLLVRAINTKVKG